MKTYKYLVKGADSLQAAESIRIAVCKIIPEAEEIAVSVQESCLRFSCDLKANEIEEREKALKGALTVIDAELILPANTETYTHVTKAAKKPFMIPVSLTVALIAAFSALTMLLTFVSCGGFFTDPNNTVVNGGTTDSGSDKEEQVDLDGIPDYIADLIKLDEVFRQESYDGIDEEKMGDAVLKAYIAATGDLYAEYMNAEEYEAYNSESAGEFVGIGVSIVNSVIEINGYNYKVLEVISVFEGSPALEYGVKVGDCILYVGGNEERVMVDVLGYTKALDVMLGEAGSLAEFTVFRPDKSEALGYKEIEFSIPRRKVVTQSVKYRISETNSKVGIVYISGFDMTTAPQFTQAVDALLAENCEYFVFDVRNNPGGSLYSIEAVLSYFLSEGDLIVSTETADGRKQEDFVAVKNYGPNYVGYNVSKSDIGKYKGLNCIVLTNENSASAAELFTATMRDYGIAEIVGTKTYGKGCMQNIIPLKNRCGLEGALRVTVAMYFSKSHTVYHNIGIVPDHEVELSEEAKEYNFFLLPEEIDNQLQKAIEELTK